MRTPSPHSARRAARNARCADLRARGVPWRKIAAREGVALSTVQRGVAEHERAVDVAATAAQTVVADASIDIAGRPSDLDAEAMYMEVIAAHLRAMEELATLAQTADHAGARVGAAKARVQTARSLAELLAMVGLLPDPARVLVMHAERQAARTAARHRGEALLAEASR